MTQKKFIKFFTFAMIPLSILGSAIMKPKFGSIHLLPHWLLIIISIPILMLLIIKEDYKLRFGLNIKKELHIKHYIWFLIFWLFYCFISINWTEDKLYGLKLSVLFFIVVALILLIIANINSLYDLKIILWFYISILLINYVVVYLEIFYNFHLPSSSLFKHYGIEVQDKLQMKNLFYLSYLDLMKYTTRITGVFYNTNSLGTFFGLTIPLIFSNYFLGNKKISVKILSLLLCFIGFFLSIYIGSRGYFIVIILMILIYLILVKWKYKVFIFLILGILFYLLLFNILPFLDISSDMSLQIRKELILTGMGKFLNSFLLLGTGAGSFTGYHLHNLYAEILFKFGFFIFITYLLFYLFILRNLYIISKKAINNEIKYMAQGLFVSLCCYTVGCTSDSSRLLSFDSWIIIAMSLVIINIYRTEKSK